MRELWDVLKAAAYIVMVIVGCLLGAAIVVLNLALLVKIAMQEPAKPETANETRSAKLQQPPTGIFGPLETVVVEIPAHKPPFLIPNHLANAYAERLDKGEFVSCGNGTIDFGRIRQDAKGNWEFVACGNPADKKAP